MYQIKKDRLEILFFTFGLRTRSFFKMSHFAASLPLGLYGGYPANPRHCCAHGIHLREYEGASQGKAGGESTTTSVPDAVVAVRITAVISHL